MCCVVLSLLPPSGRYGAFGLPQTSSARVKWPARPTASRFSSVSTVSPINHQRGTSSQPEMVRKDPTVHIAAATGDLVSLEELLRKRPEELERRDTVCMVCLRALPTVLNDESMSARAQLYNTPLHVACMKDNPGAVSLLLSLGADANAKASVRDCLNHAIRFLHRVPPHRLRMPLSGEDHCSSSSVLIWSRLSHSQPRGARRRPRRSELCAQPLPSRKRPFAATGRACLDRPPPFCATLCG